MLNGIKVSPNTEGYTRPSVIDKQSPHAEKYISIVCQMALLYYSVSVTILQGISKTVLRVQKILPNVAVHGRIPADPDLVLNKQSVQKKKLNYNQVP